jgi:hypothetical protein
MFPAHCKEVSVKSVTFPLTEQGIVRFLEGKRAYIRTKYFLFNNKDDWAIVRIRKKEANSILQPITNVDVVALPGEVSFVEDPSLDVLSASLMGSLRDAHGKRAIVVRGKSDHVSFFVDEPPFEMTVFDVVPPSPTKLADLLGSVLASDLQDHYIKARVVEVDLNEIAEQARTATVMYPCRASGLKGGKTVMYLDETPWLSEEEVERITLVGCSLSCRIFKAIYGCEPRSYLNMCPVDIAKARGVKGPALLKCCKVKEGFELSGDMAVVPWGARASDVLGAVRALLR